MKKKSLIMGILNVTPDSFSDGGLYMKTDAALEHVESMVEAGADIIDIGGESTRPGAKPVSHYEEVDRVVPIVEAICSKFKVELSIDTRHFEVAKAGLAAGGSGIFTVANDDGRQDSGDSVDYPKNTGFDNHYHDCDEYWIVFEGRGVAVSEGKSYAAGPGDCIATGMGHHHDFPQVFEPVKAVYFETTLAGQRR